MKIEIIRDETRWLLETINEQFEAIQQHGDKIPQIEFDILMENVRKFYSDMMILQKLNNPVPVPAAEKPSPPPAAMETRVASSVAAATYAEMDPKDSQVAEPAPQPVDATPSFRPAGQPPKPESASSRKVSKGPEIDLFGTEEPVFSIRLKEAREKSHPRIQSDRIENLRTAININEKFMFINELFDGNLREYNETIETLNGFKTLDQAADFLDLMRKKNFWDTASNAFKKLKELVERRY